MPQILRYFDYLSSPMNNTPLEEKIENMCSIELYSEFIEESRIAISWTGKNELRHSILNFISEKERVSRIELEEYLLSLPEEKGKKPDFKWIKRNKHLVKRNIDENGPNFYTLTQLGKRILKLTRINE